MPSIAVAIAHKKTDPMRVVSLGCLRRHIRAEDGIVLIIEDGPGPQNIWSVSMWRKALMTDCTHVVCLNDDTLVAPAFVRILRAMLEAVPEHVLALSSEHPRGPSLLASGHHWYTTRAWIAGWGYVMPRPLLEAFLPWHAEQDPERVRVWGEDQLINEWHGQTGRNTWHPCPTIVAHNVGILSTFSGQFPDPKCNTTVPWDHHPEHYEAMQSSAFWVPRKDAPHLLLPNEGG